MTSIRRSEFAKDAFMQKDDHEMMEKNSWSKQEMEKMEMDEKHTVMEGNSGSMLEDASGMSMMKKEESQSGKTEIIEKMKLTGYMNYDEAKLKDALASGQKVALFFAASWCPTCRALDASINSNLSSIPQDTLIVKVDYDNSEELKKKYSVTVQHTTVLIDREMNFVSKKLGARNVSEIFN